MPSNIMPPDIYKFSQVQGKKKEFYRSLAKTAILLKQILLLQKTGNYSFENCTKVLASKIECLPISVTFYTFTKTNQIYSFLQYIKKKRR
jgi:hypothetical protein